MGRSAYSELGATTPARPSTAPAGRRALRSRTTLELPIPDLPAGECASPLAVEHDRDRPVVDELDLHPGAEDPVLHGDPELTQRSAEPLVAPFRLRRSGRAAEARPVTLARVRAQRELTDDEYTATGVEHCSIEATLVVLEDPQPRDLPGEAFGVGGFVSGGHPEQHEQTILDLPHDAAAGPHRRTGDALDHGPHVDP